MTTTATLEMMACDLCEKESCRANPPPWDNLATQSLPGIGSTKWLLHDLLSLLSETHDRPVHCMAPMIRQIIVERVFNDDSGDTVVDHDLLSQIDQQVDIFVRILEQVRRYAIESGQWSDAPAISYMFG